MVWHATQLNPFDAWVLHWQELAYHRGHRVAAVISGTVLPVAVLTAVAGAAQAWLVDRWDALVLALVAVPSTLCVKTVLKQLVHRQWPGGPELLHVRLTIALAAAAALVAVLVALSFAHPHLSVGSSPGWPAVRAPHHHSPPGGGGALTDRPAGRRRDWTAGDPGGGARDHGLERSRIPRSPVAPPSSVPSRVEPRSHVAATAGSVRSGPTGPGR